MLVTNKSPVTSLYLWCRCYIRKDDLLVLCLEMFLDKAVLDAGLMGLGRVRRQHLLSSTGALQHRGERQEATHGVTLQRKLERYDGGAKII